MKAIVRLNRIEIMTLKSYYIEPSKKKITALLKKLHIETIQILYFSKIIKFNTNAIA